MDIVWKDEFTGAHLGRKTHPNIIMDTEYEFMLARQSLGSKSIGRSTVERYGEFRNILMLS